MREDDALALRRMRREVDDARPLGLAQQRQCGPDAVHHAHDALVDGLPPLVVGEVLEGSHRTRARDIDEDVELTVPPATHFVENPLGRFGIGDVGDQRDRIGAAAAGQVRDRLIEHRLSPADDGDARSVVG